MSSTTVTAIGASDSFAALFEESLKSSDMRIGDPNINGASVKATVVDQFRADKVTNFKYKRRKGYHRTKGHRRALTRVRIESISA